MSVEGCALLRIARGNARGDGRGSRAERRNALDAGRREWVGRRAGAGSGMIGAIVGPGAMRVAAMLLVLVTAFAGGRSAAPVDPALAAFLQAGGVLADICGGPDGHGGDPAAPHCDACMPFSAPVAGPRRRARAAPRSSRLWPFRRRSRCDPFPRRSPGDPRAPPAVLT